jgi:predicted Zn finger-like uncharacterized protein
MQIACPSCSAEYEVPAARMKPGRKARCSRCGTEWPLPAPAEPEPEAPPASAAITATDRPGPAASRPPWTASLAAAWLLTFLILAGGATSTIVWRAGVIRAWPPSSRILLLFGHLPEKPADMPAKKQQ